MIDETELLGRARRYDRLALAEIYDRYSPGIYRYARRLLGDDALAEDCVAETFRRFLQALRNQRGPRDYLQAYLYRIAHNWITDQFRHPSTEEELREDHRSDGAQDPEDAAQHRLQQDRVQQAIRKLTPEQQQVIVLKFGDGWENEQIARALHKPVGSVKSLQHRALVRLQGLLEKDME